MGKQISDRAAHHLYHSRYLTCRRRFCYPRSAVNGYSAVLSPPFVVAYYVPVFLCSPAKILKIFSALVEARPASCRSGKIVSTPAGSLAQSVARGPQAPVVGRTIRPDGEDYRIHGTFPPRGAPSRSPSVGIYPACSDVRIRNSSLKNHAKPFFSPPQKIVNGFSPEQSCDCSRERICSLCPRIIQRGHDDKNVIQRLQLHFIFSSKN